MRHSRLPSRAHRDAVDWSSRAKAVRGALKDAFRAYEKDASGFDDLAPVSRRGVNWLHSRATLVDALDSLYVVGLREDYERAVTEVLRPTLVGEPPFWQSVSVFEYHIRVVGGLLGAFEVSGDRRLLHAASHAADRVLSVLPRKLGDAYTRTRQRLADPYGRPILWLVARIIDEVQARWPGQHKDCASLAGIGSFGLELRVLSLETGDVTYKAAADRIFDQLHEGWRADGGGDMKRWMKGFYGKNCNFNNRLHARRGLGSGGDSFYEYLLKEQLVGDDSEARAAMYDWVESRLMREALPNEHLASNAACLLPVCLLWARRLRSAGGAPLRRVGSARSPAPGSSSTATGATGIALCGFRCGRPTDKSRHAGVYADVTPSGRDVDFHRRRYARPRAWAPTARARRIDGMLCDPNMWRASSTSTGRPATRFTGTGAGPCSRRSSRIAA